jgi:hypothetical protein
MPTAFVTVLSGRTNVLSLSTVSLGWSSHAALVARRLYTLLVLTSRPMRLATAFTYDAFAREVVDVRELLDDDDDDEDCDEAPGTCKTRVTVVLFSRSLPGITSRGL